MEEGMELGGGGEGGDSEAVGRGLLAKGEGGEEERRGIVDETGGGVPC